jgi:hypothetical protein
MVMVGANGKKKKSNEFDSRFEHVAKPPTSNDTSFDHAQSMLHDGVGDENDATMLNVGCPVRSNPFTPSSAVRTMHY